MKTGYVRTPIGVFHTETHSQLLENANQNLKLLLLPAIPMTEEEIRQMFIHGGTVWAKEEDDVNKR